MRLHELDVATILLNNHVSCIHIFNILVDESGLTKDCFLPIVTLL